MRRIGEEPFGELDPLVQLADFGAEGVELVENRRGGAGGHQVIALRFPAADQPPLGVTE